MEENILVYVGLDVHKDTIAVSVADSGRTPARYIGTLVHDVDKLFKMLGKLGQPGQLLVVYEAVARELTGFVWSIGMQANKAAAQ